jgi:hypothetical protein
MELESDGRISRSSLPGMADQQKTEADRQSLSTEAITPLTTLPATSVRRQ